MNAPDWMDMAAAYALGTLSPEERQAFEVRLVEDSALRAEVVEYERVMGELGRLAEPIEPPPQLRARILDRAAAVRPLHGGRGTEVHDPEGTQDPPRRAGVPTWIAWGLAAAGLIVAAGLWNARQSVERDRAAVQAEYEDALGRLQAADSMLAARDSLLEAIRGRDVRSATLAGAEGEAAARVFYDATDGQFAVFAFDLPDPPAGRTYQLWAIAEGGAAPVSVGTFDVVGGAATVRVPASQAVRGIEDDLSLAALTVEPAGGSPQPTETPRYVGAWDTVGGSTD